LHLQDLFSLFLFCTLFLCFIYSRDFLSPYFYAIYAFFVALKFCCPTKIFVKNNFHSWQNCCFLTFQYFRVVHLFKRINIKIYNNQNDFIHLTIFFAVRKSWNFNKKLDKKLDNLDRVLLQFVWFFLSWSFDDPQSLIPYQSSIVHRFENDRTWPGIVLFELASIKAHFSSD